MSIWIDAAGLQIYMVFSYSAQIISVNTFHFNFTICKSLLDEEVKSLMLFKTNYKYFEAKMQTNSNHHP